MAETCVDSHFASLKIASFEPLLKLETEGRHACPKCKNSRMYFCYKCFCPVGDATGVPNMKLPLKCDIIKHRGEKSSKSTAIHARVLAPNDVTIYDYPGDIPEYPDDGKTVLLFPSKDAVDLSEIDPRTVERVVFIDSTWQQAGGVLRAPQLQHLKRVRIRVERTRFWRVQNLDPFNLATVEAIYYLYRHYAEDFECGGNYDGRYDDLLYYFIYLYNKIQKTYITEKKHNTKFDKIGYIKYDKAAAVESSSVETQGEAKEEDSKVEETKEERLG
eukprot:Colp12_sorted_trinity150504_noHs@12529